VLRNEDESLLRGAGLYLDDLRFGQVFAVFVRSTEASAGIRAVRTAAAAGAEGVVAVATAADLVVPPVRAHASGLLPAVFDRPPLARGVVRFVGEPIAVVVARTLAAAVDAAELVEIDYEPAAVVVDTEAALRDDAPLLFPDHGTNLAFEFAHADAGALDDADVIVGGRFVNQRVAPAPMETYGVLAVPEPDGRLTVWASTQRVHALRDDVSGALGLAPDRVRVVTPLVGGAFGGKYDTPAEVIVIAALARRLARPVAWRETRSENLVTMGHGRSQVQYADLGLTGEGHIVGLRCRLVGDAGAYPALGALVPSMAVRMLPWVYGIGRLDARCLGVATNTSPMGAYRGPGRAEAGALVERLVDQAAVELGMDPVELRRRNLIPPEAFPYRTVTGMVYDVGEYRRALDTAVDLAGYDLVRREQAQRRQARATRALGIGVAMWLDITPSNRPGEYAAVDIDSAADGDPDVVVRAGTCDQSHATTWGIIVSSVLGIPADRVQLLPSDTAEVPTGTGTGSARSLQVTGGSVLHAARLVLAQARAVAGHLLEAAPEDVVLAPSASGDARHLGAAPGPAAQPGPAAEAGLCVAGSPDRRVTWADVARAARGEDLPADVRALLPRGGLGAEADVEQAGPSFPYGAHVAVVEVDIETGAVDVIRFVAVDDCGTVINPAVVTGQQHGGIVQGIGQALWEQIRHAGDGTPQNTTFADYAVPSAAEVPPIEAHTIETPTPINTLGAKGIGQAGAIGATPAVQNAVVDALAHLGVRHIDLPLTPERVWRSIGSVSR
jgi:carbon-monoxide dehydrogenase large subunit